MSGDGARPHIGLWGTFDLDNYGDLVLAHIGKRELARRMPEAMIRPFAPFGWFHPVGFEGIEPAEPLGVWSEDRVSRIAGGLDGVVIGGGDIIHTEVASLAHAYRIEPSEMRGRDPSAFFIDGLGPTMESDRPVVWSAVGVPIEFTPKLAARVRRAAARRPFLSVRDDRSRRRLEAAGVEQEIAVVPDPAVLLPQVFPPAQLDHALGYARLMDWFPADGPALAIQGNGRLISWVPALAEAIARLLQQRAFSVVTVEIGPCHGDGEFAHALHGALRATASLYHVPGTARLDHVAAAINGASAFVGSSLHGAITAFAYGRPYVMLVGDEMSKMEGFAALAGGADPIARTPEEVPEALRRAEDQHPASASLSRLQARVDAHFDSVAEILAGAAAGDGPPRPLTSSDRMLPGAVLVKAQASRERRLAAERASVAARLSQLESALVAKDAAIASRDASLEETREELSRLRASLEALEAAASRSAPVGPPETDV